MNEDSYLDTFMEDRMSGGGYWDHDETYGADPYFDYDDEPEADDEADDEADYVREDFGWFGDEALCGE
jgi:hypothetical protein